MSITKIAVTMLTIMSLTVILQYSHAQTSLSFEKKYKFNQIVHIVDPALIAGTEVLIEDL
jgi:hypothetical protein